MANLKYYDTATSEWKTLVIGAKGDQGDPGPTGPTGATGPQGDPGLASVTFTSPITNSGTSTNANVGIDLSNIAPITSPTFTGTVTGTPADGTTATAATSFGYMGVPQSSAAETTGSYTITSSDAGKNIYASATRTVTIPANSSVPLPIGTTIAFIAAAGATMTIAITTDTLLIAGTGAGGSGTSRTLAPHGVATAIKVTPTLWYISGSGIS